MTFKNSIRFFFWSVLASSALVLAGFAASPSIGPWPVVGNLPVSGGAYSNFTTAPTIITTTTAGSNLSFSPSGCTITGTGTVLGLTASGSYVYDLTLNGTPVYQLTASSLAVWNAPGGTWIISSISGIGGSPASYLSGGTGALLGQNFNTVVGTAVISGSCTALATGYLSTAASVPCSSLIISSSVAGCSISSGSANSSATFPVPVNVPLQLPVNNVNALWVFSSGTAAASVGYLYMK